MQTDIQQSQRPAGFSASGCSTSEASKIARRLCPNWMHPTGDAHYRDVKREIERLLEDRANLVAAINGVLASATPSAKEHPTMFAAWAAAQAALSNDGTQRRLPPPLSNDNTKNENGGSRSLE